MVKVKGRKIKRGDEIYRGEKAREFIEEMGKRYGMVYVMDVDGYKRNSPNLSFYKKLDCPIWIDSFPRYLEDVMDLVVSGFERISIWDMKDENLAEVRDMCEIEIFIGDEDEKEAKRKAIKYGFKGIILEEGQREGSDGKKMEIWKIYMNEWMVKRIE